MSVVLASSKNAEEAYRALREALLRLSDRASPGGGEVEARICPVCQENRTGCGWWGDVGTVHRMCMRCRDEGYFPGEHRWPS